jgi:DNA polymerase epsilon subunit 1
MGLPCIVNDFPVLSIQVNQADNEFPALDWIRSAAKNMSARFVEVENIVRERIHFSRYSLIPVCNLSVSSSDAPLFIIDTLYARALTLSKHILWYSDTTRPDLGGHEEKDFRSYFQEELENPEVCKKGFYRGYTVELDLSILAVNTIMQSEFLKEFEEASAVAGQLQAAASGELK